MRAVFDSHCHIQDAPLYEHAQAIIANARAAGVTGMLTAGVDPDGWTRQLKLAQTAHDVHVAIGVHPWTVARAPEAVDDLLTRLQTTLSAHHSEVIAVGEIGLDAMPNLRASLATQTQAFANQLTVARNSGLPVVLHIVRAHEAALATLKAENRELRGVVHSFTGSAELAGRYLRLGLHLSVSGSILRQSPSKLRRLLDVIPVDRLLVETDAPYQCPQVVTDEPYQPAHLRMLIDRLADLATIDRLEFADRTRNNAEQLWQLDRTKTASRATSRQKVR